jgi:alpha-N-arabinofuranosidase
MLATTAFLAATTALARAQTIEARVEANQERGNIHPYVYGQFVEHIGGIINHGIWAEMLDDRKFYHPVTSKPAETSRFGRFAPRRWTPVGADEHVRMDTQRPYSGDQAVLVDAEAVEPRGIRQDGLALRARRRYAGRVVLAGDPGVRVRVSLVWGPGADDRDSVDLGPIATDYATRAAELTAGASSAEGRLEITGTGQGAFRVGAVSLMPADNVEGWRADVIAALKRLRSGVYRFPGGNFVSAHEWRDAIGDRDRRPSRVDPAWNTVQPNDVGTDEFMTFCRLVDAEPCITVNAGFGDARSAADYVEYANGSVATAMGRLRAAHGHPEPYKVRLWAIGNEMWGEWSFGVMPPAHYQLKHNLFAREMRRLDPTIELIASGAMPDAMTGSKQALRVGGTVVPEYLSPGDWSGGLLSHCLENMDFLSEHFYSYSYKRFDADKGERVDDPKQTLVEWARQPATQVRVKAEHYEQYLARIPALRSKKVPLYLDEWAYSGVNPAAYRLVLAYAWAFHEMFRHAELYRMAGFTFATSLLSDDRVEAVLNPSGLLFELYRNHFGTIPLAVSGNAPQPAPLYPARGDQPRVNPGSDTYPLDVVAAWTADRRVLTVAVLNPTESEQSLDLSIAGASHGGGTLRRLASRNPEDTIEVGKPTVVVVQESPFRALPRVIAIPPTSVSLYELDVTRSSGAAGLR